MSFEAVLWATSDAPIANVNEFAVMVMLAEKADSDGCSAFPARATVAKRTTVDPKTVQRTIGALLARKLIGPGDERAAEYIRADRRPPVYDLLIPYGWFPNIDRINADRAKRGKPPLTPDSRPPIAPPPAKNARSDKGRKRPRKPEEGSPAAAGSPSGGRGDSESSREMKPAAPHGGTESPERGDSQSHTGGLEDPRTSPYNPVQETTPSSWAEDAANSSTGGTAQEGGGGGDAPQEKEKDAAAALVDRLPFGARLPGPQQRQALIDLTADALAAGWSEWALKVQLTEETSSAKSLLAVYRHRLQPENLPEPPSGSPLRTVVAPTARVHRSKCPECHRPLRNSPEDVVCSDCRLEANA